MTVILTNVGHGYSIQSQKRPMKSFHPVTTMKETEFNVVRMTRIGRTSHFGMYQPNNQEKLVLLLQSTAANREATTDTTTTTIEATELDDPTNSVKPYFSSLTTISPTAQDKDDSAIFDNVVDIYEQIGVERENLALGIKPEEFLKYIGTREDLITRTLKDIDSFDRKKAEMEVDKFLLDAEMVNLLIQFGKEVEKDPNFKVPALEEEKDGFFSFRTLVIAYLAYVAYDTFPRLFRNWVFDQQESGQWTGTNIPLIDDWIETTTPLVEAAREAKAAAEAVTESTISATSTTISALDGSITAIQEPMKNLMGASIIGSELLQNEQATTIFNSITNL